MNNEFNSLVVSLIVCSLLLLSFLKLSNPLKVNRKANFWFGFFLLLWSTFWLDEIFFYITHSEMGMYFSFAFSFLQFFTPIIFYFSVLFYINPSYQFKVYDLKYLILPFLYMVNLLMIHFGNFEKHFVLLSFFKVMAIVLILIQAIFYTAFSYYLIRKHQLTILKFSSNTEEIDLSWLEYIILTIFGMSMLIAFYNIFYDSQSLHLFINLIFLIVIYFIAYYSLKQKEIYPVKEKRLEELISIAADEENRESKRKLIPDEELSKIRFTLENVMKTEKPYLDSELNLIKLSEMVSVSGHHLSYVINAGFQKNFFQYVNEYRVEYAKKLLEDKNSKFSILGIAYESGFNSKTSFNTTFKKLTRTTPSEFKKMSSDL